MSISPPYHYVFPANVGIVVMPVFRDGCLPKGSRSREAVLATKALAPNIGTLSDKQFFKMPIAIFVWCKQSNVGILMSMEGFSFLLTTLVHVSPMIQRTVHQLLGRHQ